MWSYPLLSPINRPIASRQDFISGVRQTKLYFSRGVNGARRRRARKYLVFWWNYELFDWTGAEFWRKYLASFYFVRFFPFLSSSRGYITINHRNATACPSIYMQIIDKYLWVNKLLSIELFIAFEIKSNTNSENQTNCCQLNKGFQSYDEVKRHQQYMRPKEHGLGC